MTAKEYLLKIKLYNRTLQGISEEIERLYAEAGGLKAIVYDKDRVQTSPEDRLEKMMVRIDEECNKWARMKIRYEREVRKRVEQINKLNNADHAELLRLRYVELKQDGSQMMLEEIAVRMHLSYHRVKHLHGEALQAFAKKYKLAPNST